MELQTRQTRASEAERCWREHYSHDTYLLPRADKLHALGKDPDPDAVDKVIGNTLWTECECDECKQSSDAIVCVGEEPDYDSSTAWLCRACVEKALAMFRRGQS